MKVIPFGPPNTGKGTRISEVVEELGDQWEAISVSSELKKEVKAQTSIGQEAKRYMDAGELVPDSIILKIFLERVQNATKNVFFDGFPRTIAQAKAMLEAGIKPDLVISLQVDQEVVLQRARDRIVCTACGESYTKISPFKRAKTEGICDKCGGELRQRNDDLDESVVRRRLEVYEKETKPILEFFESAGIKVCQMDNSGPNAREEFKKLVTEN